MSSGTSTNLCFPLRMAYLFICMQFLFKFWVSIFSYKAPTREHCCHTCALDVANIWVCFMNGSMIEHNGLGITFFSVDILKDMVACWYAWVLMYSCQIIDYCFESLKSKCPCYKWNYYMMNMIGTILHKKKSILSFSYSRKSRN